MVLCLMITRIREWPELQMRKIKQKFMLTQVRGFPKKTTSLSCVLLPFLESPGQSTLVGLKRRTFTTTKKDQVAWKKSLVVVDMLPASGEIREKFQVNMSLTEETSSVDEVQRVLKEKLKFEVILLDANTSSTDEVSSVSAVHLELFSDCFRQTVSCPPHKRFLPRH